MIFHSEKPLSIRSKVYADERLNHNLLTITDPKGQTYLQNVYGTDSNDLNYDHVVRRMPGGPNDIIAYTYYRQVPESNNNYAVTRTVINDRMGNVSEHFFSNRNELVVSRQYTGRANPDEPTSLDPDINPPANKLRTSEALHFDPNTQAPIGDGNSVAQFFYSDNGLLTRIIDDRGNPTRYEYDTAGRMKVITDTNDNNVTYSYDKNSNVKSITELDISDIGNPNEIFVTGYEYDALNRLTRMIDNLGNTTSYKYDSPGNRISRIDALNNEIRYEYDGLSRMIWTIRDMDGDGADTNDPCDIVIKRTYDDDSWLTAQTDDNGNTTSFEYDALDRIRRIIYADGTERTTSYDVHQNPISRIDGNGIIITSSFDLLNRLINKTITPGSGVTHDPDFEDYQYDGQSRLTSAIDAGAVFKAKYDSLSNLTEETLNSRTTSYTYDGAGNKLSLEHPGGRTINYVYDALNRVRVAVDGPSSIVSYRYIGPRRIERKLYGNNTQCDYTYDPLRRLTGTTHIFDPAGANTVIDKRTYACDAVNNKTQRKDIRAGGPQLTHDYVYDDAYRLVQTTVTD